LSEFNDQFRLKQDKKDAPEDKKDPQDKKDNKANKRAEEEKEKEEEKSSNALLTNSDSPYLTEEEKKENIRDVRENLKYISTPTKVKQKAILFRIFDFDMDGWMDFRE